jgi:hypothetical membrane protein
MATNMDFGAIAMGLMFCTVAYWFYGRRRLVGIGYGLFGVGVVLIGIYPPFENHPGVWVLPTLGFILMVIGFLAGGRKGFNREWKDRRTEAERLAEQVNQKGEGG